MEQSRQFCQILIVCLMIAQGFAISCSQCHSLPGQFSKDCQVGHRRTVKNCPATAPYCVTKTVIPSAGIIARKLITVIRGCSTKAGSSECVNNSGQTTCTNICQENACNLQPLQIFRQTSTASSSAQTQASTAIKLLSTSADSTQNCYQCSSFNGQNLECETNPNSSHIASCPEDRPYCSIIITTSEKFKEAFTVQRNCSNRILNKCLQHGNGVINTCFSTCSGDSCNSQAVFRRRTSASSSNFRPTPSITTTQAPRRCYECSSTHEPNCKSNPNSSQFTICPADKPYCTIKTTTPYFIGSGFVERKCSNTLLTGCNIIGRSIFRMQNCFNSCDGDLCNSMPAW